jgi:CheY-like chemotaxis protein
MKAESAGEGQGATFTLYLPVREVEKRVSATVPKIPRRSRQRTLDLEDVHILIVDDEPDARELLRAMLVSTGARISEAGSAEEAMRVMVDDPPGILLADVAMPDQDGYSMIRALRVMPEGRRLRAIAVSAYARREDKKRALAAGYDTHVAKPVERQEIFEAIERVSRQRQEPPRADADSDSDAQIH